MKTIKIPLSIPMLLAILAVAFVGTLTGAIYTAASAAPLPKCAESALHVTHTPTSFTARLKNNGPSCTVWVSSYTVPETWNGQPFSGNPTALPQHRFWFSQVTVTTESQTYSVVIPPCGPYQIDLTTMKPPKTLTSGSPGFVNGDLYRPHTTCETSTTSTTTTPSSTSTTPSSTTSTTSTTSSSTTHTTTTSSSSTTSTKAVVHHHSSTPTSTTTVVTTAAQLPRTGFDAVTWAAIALGILGVGVGVLLLTRKSGEPVRLRKH